MNDVDDGRKVIEVMEITKVVGARTASLALAGRRV